MNDLTQLDYQFQDHIVTLTLNSPPVNALTRVLNDELTMALDRISEMDEVRVVILTGAGKIFCAGADLKGVPRSSRVPATCWRIPAARASASTRFASAPSR